MANFSALQNKGAHAQTLDFSKAVAVSSGERIDFSKANPLTTVIRAELHWDGGYDADASVMILDSLKQALKGLIDPTLPKSTRGMVWYGNLGAPGIVHTGDARQSGDDPSMPEETVIINLLELDQEANEVVIVASTFPEDDLGQGPAIPFGRIRNCRVDVIDDKTDVVLYTYELDEDYSTFTSVELLSLYKRNGEFKLVSMGEGVGASKMALGDIAKKYGLN